MRILGPTDLLTAATTVRDGVVDAADLWPRTLDLMARVEDMVLRGEELLDQAEVLLARAAATREHVDEVADRAGRTADRAEALVARTESLLALGEQQAPLVGPMLDKAVPIASEVVGSISRDEVLAMVSLIDRLPAALRQIDQIAPDVHEILDAVTDLSHAAQGLPGMSSIIRRGERKDDGETTRPQPQPPTQV